MEQLLKDLKQQTFKSVYLLSGEEAYLRNQYKKRLRDAMTERFGAFGCVWNAF